MCLFMLFVVVVVICYLLSCCFEQLSFDTRISWRGTQVEKLRPTSANKRQTQNYKQTSRKATTLNRRTLRSCLSKSVLLQQISYTNCYIGVHSECYSCCCCCCHATLVDRLCGVFFDSRSLFVGG